MDIVTLYNGLKVPQIGMGATGLWCRRDDDLCRKQYDIYCHILESNFNPVLFDTSESYGQNERVLGEAIKDTNNKNSLVMSKVSNQSQREDGGVRRAFENTLRLIGRDYIDVYLFHWPVDGCYYQTWHEMEKIYEEGLAKAIGVCNCNIHHLEELGARNNIKPMINEFELHPLFTQSALENYCKAFDIQVVAYTPIARMLDVLIEAKPVRLIAKKYGKTPVQIILRWHLQQGRIAIPRTLSKNHFLEIMDVYSFSMTDKEIAWISSLDDGVRVRFNSDRCDFNIL